MARGPRRPHRPSHSAPPQARRNRHADERAPLPQLSEDELFQMAGRSDDILILILDGVQDPHNLGACLRSANAAGAAAVVVPRHHSCHVTDTVRHIACGAAEDTPVITVTNLARFMEQLRDSGVRIVGTADEAVHSIYETNLTGRLALAMGAEGTGLRRLTSENCDELIVIPMNGTVECLNVSAATAVCLFEAVRQRTGKAR